MSPKAIAEAYHLVGIGEMELYEFVAKLVVAKPELKDRLRRIQDDHYTAVAEVTGESLAQLSDAVGFDIPQEEE